MWLFDAYFWQRGNTTGVGYSQAMANWFVSTYYCALLAITFFYLMSSFRTVLPWTICHPHWINCYDSGVAAAANASVLNTTGIEERVEAPPLSTSRNWIINIINLVLIIEFIELVITNVVLVTLLWTAPSTASSSSSAPNGRNCSIST